MLTDLVSIKQFMNLSDGALDGILNAIIAGVDAGIKNYCKQNLETQLNTEWLDGSNINDLTLGETPVHADVFTGNITAGSAQITNLTNVGGSLTTSALGVGLCAIAPYSSTVYLTGGSSIQSVDSATQVTLTQPALISATGVKLIFGPMVWIDSGGFYEEGQNAFSIIPPPSTTLTLGHDYALKRDARTFPGLVQGYSRSGILKRLGGGPQTTLAGWWPWLTADMRSGGMTARAMPSWTNWIGNFKVTYMSVWGMGSGLNSGTLPADLTMAANQLCAWQLRNARAGGITVSETTGRYSITTQQALNRGQVPDIGSTRQILGRYRMVL